MMFIFDNVLSESEVTTYHNFISNHYKNMISLGHDPGKWHPTRNVNITRDSIVIKIREFIESNIRVKLTVGDAEMQTWPVGSYSLPHVHDDNGRAEGDYNSLLYLNEDFSGGEFFTQTGIIIKPVRSRLTFFNGRETYHGLNPVQGVNRHTIIVWWKNTEFY